MENQATENRKGGEVTAPRPVSTESQEKIKLCSHPFCISSNAGECCNGAVCEPVDFRGHRITRAAYTITEEPIPNPDCFGKMRSCTEMRCWAAEECRVETEAAKIDAAYEAGRDAGMGVPQ